MRGGHNVQRRAHGNGAEIRFVLDAGQLQPEHVRIIDQIAHGQQFGDVVARFGRHVQVFVCGGKSGGLRAADGAAHVAFAPVVGGQRERPVAEESVQVLQIIQCGIGGGRNVVPPVIHRGLFQAVVAAGGGHKLPQTRRADMGARLGHISAFDEGQQGDFGRHAASLHLIDNVVHIRRAASQSAVEITAVGHEAAFMIAH